MASTTTPTPAALCAMLKLPDELHVQIVHHMLGEINMFSAELNNYRCPESAKSYAHVGRDVLRPMMACKKLFGLAKGEMVKVHAYHIKHNWLAKRHLSEPMQILFHPEAVRYLFLDLELLYVPETSDLSTTLARVDKDLLAWFPNLSIDHVSFDYRDSSGRGEDADRKLEEVNNIMGSLLGKMTAKQFAKLTVSKKRMMLDVDKGRKKISMHGQTAKEVVECMAKDIWNNVVIEL